MKSLGQGFEDDTTTNNNNFGEIFATAATKEFVLVGDMF
jgi:hypothetical protein